jgi:hypothetical protein
MISCAYLIQILRRDEITRDHGTYRRVSSGDCDAIAGAADCDLRYSGWSSCAPGRTFGSGLGGSGADAERGPRSALSMLPAGIRRVRRRREPGRRDGFDRFAAFDGPRRAGG